MARPRLAVVHHIPGRLRLRLPPGVHVPELEREVRAHPGVERFRHSPRARSVVVEYQPTEPTVDALLELVASIAGLDVDPIDAERAVLSSPLSQTISRAVSTLNAEIARRTSYHIDMRTLFAMSLLAWAAAQVI